MRKDQPGFGVSVMQIKAYLPNAKFIVGTIIVLIALTFALKAFGSNPYVAKVKTWLGLSA